jgi:hypothetical protein
LGCGRRARWCDVDLRESDRSYALRHGCGGARGSLQVPGLVRVDYQVVGANLWG